MAWNKQKAQKRVQDAGKDICVEDINVAKLSRKMDFSNLGSKEVRRVEGVHIYADVANFHLIVADAGGDKEKQKKRVRAASVLRRIQRELADEAGVGRIQMQAARFHGICHTPYDGDEENNESKRVKTAIIFAITMQSYIYDCFNSVFAEELERHLRGAVGIDSGQFLIANIGYHGDRELISLGTPANVAARIIDQPGAITITERVYELLPECLQSHFAEINEIVVGVKNYQASGLRWKDYPELAEELGVEFDDEKWTKRTKEEKEKLTLAEMDVTEATELIDIERLSERNSKRTECVVLYCDIDGFTRYVMEAEESGDEAVKTLVRIFHLIRAEFQANIEIDYDGVALQHQGDCVLAIAHLPSGDDNGNRRRRKGVDIAIAVQSSMEHVLREHFGKRKELHVTVGADVGKVLVTRLGIRGEREVVSLGMAVTAAQSLQMKSHGGDIRISEMIYEAISDDTIQGEFRKNGDSYVAIGLTFPTLDDLREEKAAEAGTLGSRAVGSVISVIPSGGRQSSPWYRGW